MLRVGISFALYSSTQAPKHESNQKSSISKSCVDHSVVLQKKTPACLKPVFGKSFRIVFFDTSRAAFQVDDPALRHKPGRPPCPPRIQAKINVIKVCVKSLI